MPYKVEFTAEAIDDLRIMEKPVAQRIMRKVKWLSESFDMLSPESLSGEFKGLFKLKVGSYRVVYESKRDEHLLIIHLVGHRRDVYRRK